MGLKKGTVMAKSNLPYKVWLWSLYFVSFSKKGFSALELQRLVGHNRYEPIWGLMQKIGIIMVCRDEKYLLDGFIEMNEGFFEGHRKKGEEVLVNRPAKELDRQVKAIVAVSTTTAIVTTDGKPSYRTLKSICDNHTTIVVKDKKEVTKYFPGYTLQSAIQKRKYQDCITV